MFIKNYKPTLFLAISASTIVSSYGAVLALNTFSTVSDATGVTANGHTGTLTAHSAWTFTDSSFTSDNLFTSDSNFRITSADGGTIDTTSRALSPSINVDNSGPWTLTWTLTTGASDLNLDDFSFDSYRTNSSRNLQSNTGDSADLFEATFDIKTGGSSILGTAVTQIITTDGPTAAGTDSVLSLTGITLTANTTYTFSLKAAENASVSGYFVDVDTFSINGSVVPEPSSTALLGLGGLALILRRRK